MSAEEDVSSLTPFLVFLEAWFLTLDKEFLYEGPDLSSLANTLVVSQSQRLESEIKESAELVLRPERSVPGFSLCVKSIFCLHFFPSASLHECLSCKRPFYKITIRISSGPTLDLTLT